MNKRDVKLVLEQLNVVPNKSKGQSFLIDSNVLKKMILKSDISKDDIILEIGPGLGVLTEELVKKAKYVFAVEIETQFCSFLSRKFSECDNLEIINGDILKVEIPFHNKVVSNIPFTMTGPIFERIFFKNNPPIGVLTIEKSIADRIFNITDYKQISRISIGLNSFMKPIEINEVSKNCFFPEPEINLALIKLIPKDILDNFLIEKITRVFFLKFIAGIMPYKNKDIVNALERFISNYKELSFTKQDILEILQENEYENKKTFTFSVDELLEICKLFYFKGN